MPDHFRYPDIPSFEEYSESMKNPKDPEKASAAVPETPKQESIFAQFEKESPALSNRFHDPIPIKEVPQEEAVPEDELPERKSRLDRILENAREKRRLKAESKEMEQALEAGKGYAVLSAERIWDAEVTQEAWKEASVPEREEMLKRSLGVMADTMHVDPMIRDKLKLEFSQKSMADCSLFIHKTPDKQFALDMAVTPTITLPDHLCNDVTPFAALRELYRQATLVLIQNECIDPYSSIRLDSWMEELAAAGKNSLNPAKRSAIDKFLAQGAEDFNHQYEHRVHSALQGFAPTRHDVYQLPLYKED